MLFSNDIESMYMKRNSINMNIYQKDILSFINTFTLDLK